MWNVSSRRASLALRVQGTGSSPDMSSPCVLPEGTAFVQRWSRCGSAAAAAAAAAAASTASTTAAATGSPPGSPVGSPVGSGDGSSSGGAWDRRSQKRPSFGAFRAFSAAKDFSRVACLAFPEEAANASSRLGYARLQLLLGYVVPEILEEESFAEDAESRAQETAGTPEESQPALRVPYRPYIVVSLNGRDIYRSAVLRCDSTSPSACLQGVWNERIEIQLHQPYSVLRLALYDRDTSTSALGGDELLGAADFQLHLLLPQRIYDITTVFAPFAVLDEGVLSGKEEAFVVLQGNRYLHRSQDTRAIVKETSCGVCGDHGGICKDSSNSCNGVDTEGASLYTIELDEEAVAKVVQDQLQQLQQQQQQNQGEFGGCRMRLMLQLLPHKASKCSTIPLLDEVSALLLPTPQETQEAALPPLNFPAVWSDLQDAHRKLVEGPLGVLAAGLYDAVYWERPALSIACLLAFVFLWRRPCFLPSALLLLSGLMLLIVSLIQMPPPPEEASSAGRADNSTGATASSSSSAAATTAETGRDGDRGVTPLGSRQRGRPGSLKAFEVSESENCAETSLLRSLLSAAVPPSVQLRVRQCHIVGALWVLGAWAGAEPAKACSIASYLVLASGEYCYSGSFSRVPQP
ncbi:hypothetical protein, conserved [Eimeria maxima]|uniref:C2 domain-containing protein n=1 Tax=Eimeria maxima TaxID=5804 RepID=U6M1B7_EIMMA|nr:hypothetical protein, conserved [Eimeria maxima]CDJ56883.1 hypothetical protein, conserved [Eimeria maxima]